MDDLNDCIRRADYSDDCSLQARDVRDSTDEYEEAISTAESDFNGEAEDVCRPKSKAYHL
ncbi:hypothetical protein [Cognatiluteimonas profundi]|uniref:hypothetical protein n=1 Tax=Cognatiluteimonas profundi TaxID=2594501 RepID=UPI00131E792B|nr:hypothetical protein [Lysobacter profundi]